MITDRLGRRYLNVNEVATALTLSEEGYSRRRAVETSRTHTTRALQNQLTTITGTISDQSVFNIPNGY